jgi:DAACS family dicarboxylate/amino acid:cation (Na+ or H+) symporter
MESTEKKKGLALHWQIIIGLVVGAVAGLVANAACTTPESQKTLAELGKDWIKPVGQIFLRLVFMVVIPLIISALILGVAGLGDVRKLGRMGLRTLALTLLLSGASVIIGLVFANVLRPGDGLPEAQRDKLQAMGKAREDTKKDVQKSKETKSAMETIRDLIPENPFEDIAGAFNPEYSRGSGMIAVMVFALLVGIAASVAPERTGPLLKVLEGIFDISMVIIGWAMKIAPVGVAALVFSLTSVLGFDILKTLAGFVGTVLAGLAVHMFIIYSIAIVFLARRSPKWFFKGSGEAILTAFGTSSSSATLPTSLRVADQKLGLKPAVTRFVLTIGATANQNGTALYEGITILFIAQVFGTDLSLGMQAKVLLMAVLAGIGTAGVPGGSLPLVGAVLVSVGIPAEGIGIILGVDRLLDMCRTAVNVTGDLAIATIVDKSEGEAPA